MTTESVGPRLETPGSQDAGPVPCPSCEDTKTVSHRNDEGHWYCRCLTCGCRFWLPQDHQG